jgi:predicted RNA-binding protein associated with RNAse of E/G family
LEAIDAKRRSEERRRQAEKRVVQEKLWVLQERHRRELKAEEEEQRCEAAIKERQRQVTLKPLRERLQEALSPVQEGTQQLHATGIRGGAKRLPVFRTPRVVTPRNEDRYRSVRTPATVLFRSIFRGRLLYAVTGRLLEETSSHVVTATVPGDETVQLIGDRHQIIADVAIGREQTRRLPWTRTRVIWMTPLDTPYSIGHFWDHASGNFIGYYINLQDPVRRSPFGFDSMDHVLDIVIKPDLNWCWKDEDELRTAVEVGIFSASEARAIRANGERAIAAIDTLFPTGWEKRTPEPRLLSLQLPAGSVYGSDES